MKNIVISIIINPGVILYLYNIKYIIYMYHNDDTPHTEIRPDPYMIGGGRGRGMRSRKGRRGAAKIFGQVKV